MQIVPAVFSCSFFALGLWVSSKGLSLYAEAKESVTWSKVSAIIEESEVISFRGKGGVKYIPEIKYTYVANGRAYSGRTLRLVHQLPMNREFASEITAKYRLRDKVEISYNHQKPSISVLEAGVFKGTFLGIIGGVGLCGLAVWVLLFWYLLQ